MDCEIQKSEINGVPVIHLIGMVKDQDVFRFSREMRALIKENHLCITLDMSQTEYLDSHGVGLIVYFNSVLAKEQRKMLILNESQDPMAFMTGLLKTTGLDTVLTVVENKAAIYQ